MAVASTIGTTVEWYDFFIFSTAVPLVFNTQFFPTLSPASGTFAGFATLGVGIVARPVGGVFAPVLLVVMRLPRPLPRHEHQRRHEHRFAPDQIPEVSPQCSA